MMLHEKTVIFRYKGKFFYTACIYLWQNLLFKYKADRREKMHIILYTINKKIGLRSFCILCHFCNCLLFNQLML